MANILILTSVLVYKIVAHKLTKNLSQTSFYFLFRAFSYPKM